MNYYGTVKYLSYNSYWHQLKARTLIEAKREAWIRFRSGYLGHLVQIAACDDVTRADECICAARAIKTTPSQWINS